MPTYQYRCTDCGEQLEVVQKFTDDALTTCPACQGRLRKVYSAVGVVFKGSGFYRTDSRSDGKPGAPDKVKEPAGAAADSSGSGAKDSGSASSGSGSSGSGSSGSGSSGSGSSGSGSSGSAGKGAGAASGAKAGTSAA